MRQLLIICTFAACFNQSNGQDTANVQSVKQEIRNLYKEWNQARQKYDRAALESIFADNYVWVHGFGYTDDKAAAINDQLNTDSIQPVPLPNLDELQVYGNVAVLNQLIQGQQRPFYTTSIYVKKHGRWQFAHSQTTLLQIPRKPFVVEEKRLAAYTGQYEQEGRYLSIEKKNDFLQVKNARIPIRKLIPAAENKFFDKLGTEYTFIKDSLGIVKYVTVLYPNGSAESQWKKID